MKRGFIVFTIGVGVSGLFGCAQPETTQADASEAAEAGPQVTFAADIAPMLAASCNNCHSGQNLKGKLLLESHASIMQGGKSGPAIVPGDPDGSILFRMVTGQQEPAMPRKGDPLTPAQIETLRRWIQSGAKDA